MKKVAFYIYGIKEMFQKSEDISNIFEIAKLKNPDIYISEDLTNHRFNGLNGYICIAEENHFGEAVCMIEPIANGQFLDSSEVLNIALKYDMVDVSIDFYTSINPNQSYIHLKAIEFLKNTSKDFFNVD